MARAIYRTANNSLYDGWQFKSHELAATLVDAFAELSRANSMQPHVHPADLAAAKLLAECVVRRQRRSGPGGQHRNKVETAVVLVHQPTGIRSEATERRSQAANQQVAIHRLRVKLAIQVRSNMENGCGRSVSQLWRSRLRTQKISIARTHEDFPSLLAEALDYVSTLDFDVKKCAERLGTSPSQLVRFFKLEPEALIYVNEQRAKRTLKPLR